MCLSLIIQVSQTDWGRCEKENKLLALWIGGYTMPVQSVQNPSMLQWVQCLNPKVIFISYVGCLCLPQAVNYWYKVLELLSMTIWFFLYFIICQATLPSRSTLSRMTSKIEVRELLVGKLKSETPQPRVSSPDQSWSYDLRCFKRNLHVSLWFDW